MSVFPEKSAMWKQKCLAVGSEERLREERRGRELSKFNLGERSTQSQIQKTLTKDMSFYCPLEALIMISFFCVTQRFTDMRGQIICHKHHLPNHKKKESCFFLTNTFNWIVPAKKKQTDKTDYLWIYKWPAQQYTVKVIVVLPEIFHMGQLLRLSCGTEQFVDFKAIATQIINMPTCMIQLL